MEREAAELFNTAETVPGVRPRCCATAFNVTWEFLFGVKRLLFISAPDFYPALDFKSLIPIVAKRYTDAFAVHSIVHVDVLERIDAFSELAAQLLLSGTK